MHTPVLLKEVVKILDIQDGDIYLDATVGEGGHAEAVFNLRKKVVIAGIDIDSRAVEKARKRFGVEDDHLHTLNFREIDKTPEMLGIERPNKILFDLGWNRRQFETEEGKEGRGFSFQKDEPLDMRFGEETTTVKFTAGDIVNKWDEENIATIILSYGEEKFAGRIAKAVVDARKEKPIKTTFELVEIIKKATPTWYHFKKIHPATRTFQALRIAVNDELRALEEGLGKAFKILKEGGRIVVISFHSLEDRIVKRYFKLLEGEDKGKILTKKPIAANANEIKENPRSRSAKLRCLQKL